MAKNTTETAQSKCLACGFEAAADSDDWGSARHPTLGTLTQCPDCGSTNISADNSG